MKAGRSTMLSVRRITPDSLSLLTPMAEEVLVGEDALIRVTRTGFALSYAPRARAEGRTFPPPADCAPQLVAADKSAALFAAFSDSLAVGYAAVRLHAAGFGDISALQVDATHRRHGFASALMDACEDFARQHNAYGTRVCTSDENPGACQFLEHRGYVLAGLDRMALAAAPQERQKPMMRRACALFFYHIF